MLVINANSKHPDAAWKFVKFMASQPVFADYYRTQFPAQTSLLKQIDFGAPLKGFAEQLPDARTWGPYASGPVPIGTMWNATSRAFGKALSGQVSTRKCCQGTAGGNRQADAVRPAGQTTRIQGQPCATGFSSSRCCCPRWCSWPCFTAIRSSTTYASVSPTSRCSA